MYVILENKSLNSLLKENKSLIYNFNKRFEHAAISSVARSTANLKTVDNQFL